MHNRAKPLQILCTFPEKKRIVQLPVEVGAVVPNPPNGVPPKPVAAVVAVLKPPKAGADVDGAPKPIKSINMIDLIH